MKEALRQQYEAAKTEREVSMCFMESVFILYFAAAFVTLRLYKMCV